jgi:DNA-binding MarR family transcriptional regulator
MPQDTLSDFGFLFLGSRMKRLAERMQADATRIFEATGHGRLFAAFNTILATLDRHGDVAIGDLVNLIGISQPAITRTVAGMVEKNFVTLIPATPINA